MSRRNAVEIARDLLRCPSVTPSDMGALDVLGEILSEYGFSCTRLEFGGIQNMFASYGKGFPRLCFAGHTDVVPPGDCSAWKEPPFEAVVRDERLWGRGAVDMKGAIAAFAAASEKAIRKGKVTGTLSFLVTGDEEGDAVYGTRKVLEWLEENSISFDHCLVGEPTNPERIGDMIKTGRRGSMNFELTVLGKQGHVAYPRRACNPVPVLAQVITDLCRNPLDGGYEQFQPSSLQVTDVQTGNSARNVIPGAAKVFFNIRFNPVWTGESLGRHIRLMIEKSLEGGSCTYDLQTVLSGEPFLTTDRPFIDLLSSCIRKHTGRQPGLSTSGGTSDARFIRYHAPVAEFGLVGKTMHQVDENTPVADIEMLTDIYESIIGNYFTAFSS